MSRSNENNAEFDHVENDTDEQDNDASCQDQVSQTDPIENGIVIEEIKDHEENKSPISLIVSPDGSENSTEEFNSLNVSLLPPSERKPSRNLEDIDRTLDELQDLAEDAFLTAQMAQGNQAKLFDKLFESSTVYLKKCETVPEDLTKQQFSDEDGILEEIEEAVRDAEEKQYEPNHVSVVLDTECSSDDEVASDRYPGVGNIDQLRHDDNSLRNVGGHRVRQRVASVSWNRGGWQNADFKEGLEFEIA